MGLRHMHPVRDQAHDDRRGWRRLAEALGDIAACQAALAAERARSRRLIGLIAEQAAEMVLLRSALEHARDRRATA